MPTIWRIPLTTPLPPDLPLSAEEESRAARFRFERDADRYRVAHWALREILGSVMHRASDGLRFRNDASGKPRLNHPGAPPFNLSHAHELALVAVADPGESCALGVDVEYHRPVPELQGVVSSHFAPEERAAVLGANAAEQLQTFYRVWTRKEAFVKATGSGVGPALARFAVTAARDDVRILRADDYPDAVASWTIRDLGFVAPYSAALVVCGPMRAYALRDWQPGA